jgi:isoleucyl-tRNA synthetase
MSKHLGNVMEPLPLMESRGADALRWFFAATGSPWSARRLGTGALDEIVRKVLLTYWNTASFLVLYANAAAAGGDTAQWVSAAPPPRDRPLLDRWVLSELHALVRDVTAALDGFDTAEAGRRLAAFTDDLSNWYVRRSRRRFWAGPGDADGAAAFATLRDCLRTLTCLMAPFTPFLTDYLWGVLREPGDPDSVHLARWPVADESLVDARLSADMTLVRRLVELGRSARAASSVRTRQPLARGLVSAHGFAGLPAELVGLLADELNVRAMDVLAGGGGDLVDYHVKPNFKALGPRFGKGTPAVAGAITAADPAWLAGALGSAGAAEVTLADGTVAGLQPGDVIVTQTPRSGWTVAADAGETVAIEVTITPELRREGLAREVVRLVQEERKNAGLDVSDRISLWWQAGREGAAGGAAGSEGAAADVAAADVASALREHGSLIANEVLAVDYTEGRPGPGVAVLGEHTDAELGLTFWLARG